MGILGGFFNSSSETSSRTRVSDRTKNNVNEDGNFIDASLGGLTIKGGGKKSVTRANVKIVQTDHGATASAEKIALASQELTRDTNEGALELAARSLDGSQENISAALGLAGENSLAANNDQFKSILMLAGVAVLVVGGMAVWGRG